MAENTTLEARRVRDDVVRLALSQEYETDHQRYWRSAIGREITNDRTDWCGAFVLWCLHSAGIATQCTWVLGLGLETSLPLVRRTREPQPGDVAYFTRNQHVAIVARAEHPLVQLVNGNSRPEHGAEQQGLPLGPLVTVNERHMATVAAFYSIERYLWNASGAKRV